MAGLTCPQAAVSNRAPRTSGPLHTGCRRNSSGRTENMRLKLTTTVAALALFVPGVVLAQDTIKIGLLAPQEGVFTEPGTDGIRGFELALNKYGGEVAGKKIEWVLGPTDATPDTALRQARRLIEQEGVDFILGPLSGSEGVALRDYAKT